MRARSVVAALGALAVAVMVVRRRLAIITIAGESMEPALTAGDRVLIRRTGLNSVRTGQIVVIERPGRGDSWTGKPSRHDISRNWIIKRVAAVAGETLPLGMPTAIAHAESVPDGHLIVLGDNRDMSMDSRYFGYVPVERMLGVVIRLLPRRTGQAFSVIRATRD
jgi:signal peptidase I